MHGLFVLLSGNLTTLSSAKQDTEKKNAQGRSVRSDLVFPEVKSRRKLTLLQLLKFEKLWFAVCFTVHHILRWNKNKIERRGLNSKATTLKSVFHICLSAKDGKHDKAVKYFPFTLTWNASLSTHNPTFFTAQCFPTFSRDHCSLTSAFRLESTWSQTSQLVF